MSHKGEKHVSMAPVPAASVTSLHQLSALLPSGRVEALARYEGRVCLVVNMASGDVTTGEELTRLNELVSALGPRGLSVLVFPCNQFGGGLEPFSNDEIPLVLQHVRPGGRFEPLFTLFGKCEVNGRATCPVYEFLRLRLPAPGDDSVVLSRGPAPVAWRPITRSDVGWNYEKFLVSFDGQPVKRYTHSASLEVIQRDAETLLRKIPKAVRESLGLVAFEKQRVLTHR